MGWSNFWPCFWVIKLFVITKVPKLLRLSYIALKIPMSHLGFYGEEGLHLDHASLQNPKTFVTGLRDFRILPQGPCRRMGSNFSATNGAGLQSVSWNRPRLQGLFYKTDGPQSSVRRVTCTCQPIPRLGEQRLI